MSDHDFPNNFDDFKLDPDDEKLTWFLMSRHVIEYSAISPETKGYYAMYIAECIEWEDIPFTNREELYSVPNFEEVEE